MFGGVLCILNGVCDGLQRKPHIERYHPLLHFAVPLTSTAWLKCSIKCCVYYAISVNSLVVRSETQVDCVAYIHLNYSVPTQTL